MGVGDRDRGADATVTFGLSERRIVERPPGHWIVVVDAYRAQGRWKKDASGALVTDAGS